MPSSNSTFIELCSISTFAATLHTLSDKELNQAFVACITPELCSAVAAADPKDYKSPELQAMLNEFEDVLVSSIPGGLPPKRVDADGRPTPSKSIPRQSPMPERHAGILLKNPQKY